MLSFGQRLRILRKEANLSQTDLAEQLFVSVQSVSKWECDNAMPDIGQIVPLAAILGVSTDCILGVGTDEKADREKLKEEWNKIWEKCNGNSYENNAYYKSYELVSEFLKKYPLAYDYKLWCANNIYCFLSNSLDKTRYVIPEEEEKTLFNVAEKYLMSVINRSNNPCYLLEARETLVALYVYKKDYEKAIAAAEELPKDYSIKERQLLEIYDRQKDYEKALESANKICNDYTERYLQSLFDKGRRISLFGNVRKQEAIAAWYDLLDAAKLNYRIFGNDFPWACIIVAYNMLSNDYIAISEFDKVFEIMNEYVDFGVDTLRSKKATAPELFDQFKVYINAPEDYLRQCYNWCFETDDNIITKDPRYKKCFDKLASEIEKLKS